MRNLLCATCADRMIGWSKEYEESFRAVKGTIIEGPYCCDSCCGALKNMDIACAYTSHPKGHEMIGQWEDKYIHQTDKEEA